MASSGPFYSFALGAVLNVAVAREIEKQPGCFGHRDASVARLAHLAEMRPAGGSEDVRRFGSMTPLAPALAPTFRARLLATGS